MLNDLGLAHNTDKASRFTKKDDARAGHDYLRVYEHFFEKFRGQEGVQLLELGAGNGHRIGASARVWEGYFGANAQIHIADIKLEAAAIATDVITPTIGDLGDPEFVKTFADRAWDIIVDDASHKWEHQLLALRLLLPAVKPGGVFVVEDVHTSQPRRGRHPFRGRFGRDVNGLWGGPKAFFRPDMSRILSLLADHLALKEATRPRLLSPRVRQIIEDIAPLCQTITFMRGSAVIVRSAGGDSYLNGTFR